MSVDPAPKRPQRKWLPKRPRGKEFVNKVIYRLEIGSRTFTVFENAAVDLLPENAEELTPEDIGAQLPQFLRSSEAIYMGLRMISLRFGGKGMPTYTLHLTHFTMDELQAFRDAVNDAIDLAEPISARVDLKAEEKHNAGTPQSRVTRKLPYREEYDGVFGQHHPGLRSRPSWPAFVDTQLRLVPGAVVDGSGIPDGELPDESPGGVCPEDNGS